MNGSREGDPILSPDGKHILGKWRVSAAFEGSWFNVAYIADLEEAGRLAGMSADVCFRATPRMTVERFAVMPDRTYWRFVNDPPEMFWERNSYFTHPDAKIDPANPQGMVAAIAELLARHQPDFQTASWLDYIKGYYQHVADRQAEMKRKSPARS
jgi:hypothetical protein